jgi:hypothetical protein
MNAHNHLRDASAAIEVVATEAQDIAHISADYCRSSGHRKHSLLDTITEKVDSLLGIMMETVYGPVSPKEVSTLLKTHYPLTESRLASLPTWAVPLIVMRELISLHQTPIKRERIQNWKLFADTYRGSV